MDQDNLRRIARQYLDAPVDDKAASDVLFEQVTSGCRENGLTTKELFEQVLRTPRTPVPVSSPSDAVGLLGPFEVTTWTVASSEAGNVVSLELRFPGGDKFSVQVGQLVFEKYLRPEIRQ